MRCIPEEILAASVRGVNLMPGSLGDQLGDAPSLLVFLRRFGCGFCREILAELREAREKLDGFPPVLLFFEGSPVEGRAFLRRYWPDARAVSDPDKRFYAAFGVDRGSLRQLFGPGVWQARRRASAAGHVNGDMSGDLWRMPGVFLARGGTILWQHDFRHVGDRPDFAGMPALVARHRGGPPAAGAGPVG